MRNSRNAPVNNFDHCLTDSPQIFHMFDLFVIICFEIMTKTKSKTNSSLVPTFKWWCSDFLTDLRQTKCSANVLRCGEGQSLNCKDWYRGSLSEAWRQRRYFGGLTSWWKSLSPSWTQRPSWPLPRLAPSPERSWGGGSTGQDWSSEPAQSSQLFCNSLFSKG